jgi:sugar lactone lactonase YvrE
MPPPSELRAYDLNTGALKATYAFPMPAFCNDLALGSGGDLFVTDSFGKVYTLAHGASSLAVWSTDPLLAPASPTGLAADGIALDGAGNVYVNTFDTGRLIRIPLKGDGTAGVAAEIRVDAPLKAPDGMRMLDQYTLVVVEGAAGKLTKIAISGSTGTTTTLASALNGPSSVVKVGDNYWVTEGQLGHFLGTIPGPPSLPFLVRRIP